MTAAPTTPPPTEAPAAPAGLTVDGMVDATPDSRDRTVDAVRALAIVVVVLWHWTFSITHVDGQGALTMPNPIDTLPGAWLATWVLQVMPAFFVVGGFATMASFEALERRGRGTWSAFVRGRLARLGRPLGVFVAAWAVGDTLVRLVVDVPSVLSWGLVVFVPLWFLGTYTAVLLVAPLTLRAHRRAPWATLGLLVAGMAGADALRFTTGVDAWGLVTTALVWVFAHQLGYLWRDGTLVAWGRWAHVGLVAAGVAALALLTTVGPYPSSMVAVRGEAVSNMFPTTACIAALAVLQTGLVLLLRPRLERLLARRGPWRVVVGVNAVAMTVFAWHMTALVAVIGAALALGLTLPSEATPTWWALRPVWVVLPGLVLAVLVRTFARHELPTGARR
ncbi:acyltransferase [Iamia majanohamensis]|uniref:Acyltransferase n=1 Tax=Iamia majanohamensis TaxID=467976 RepID=A0AAE9Y5L2_9ACTN|nr:acyltransferase [Iamia majanohamensis]WCO67205.1 acyltransferase [Iamia majanohamensis]